MTTGATGQLGLALPVQGELSGTWGDTVNNGITQYTNIAIAGTLTLTGDGAVTLANTTGDASASNITSTLAGAGTVTAQFAIVRVSGTTTTKVVTGPSYSKTYVVDNASSYAVTFKASGQTGVSVAAAEKVTVVFNGTDYIKLAGTIANAAGSNTQIQFNNGGLFGASSSLTWDGTTLSSTQINITGQGTLRLQDTTGGEYVGLRSPSALGASYTLTFPADDGTSGQALITDGSGVLSWSTAASGDVYGPASATANGIALFDGTTGKLLKDSAATDGLIYGLTVGRGAGAVSTNTALGYQALITNSTGSSATGVGYQAGVNNSSGTNGTFLGFSAGYLNSTGSNNVAIGSQALYSNATESSNTAVGYQAGYSNATGDYLVALGAKAGYGNTSGRFNVAVGRDALLTNSTSSDNTAVGTNALKLTTAAGNTALGSNALGVATTGASNVGVGSAVLARHTTGSYNVGVGVDALSFNTTASYNTAVGYQAGYTNSTGTNQTFIGYQAGYSNTTGSANIAIGVYALYSNQTGIGNTAIGNGTVGALPGALYNNTASYNTAVGYLVMGVNTTGTENAAFGAEALYQNTTGAYNTALGRSALFNNTTASSNTAVGYASLYANTTGANNSAFGFASLRFNTTASNNTAVGYQAGYSNTTGYVTALGYQALYSNTTGAGNVAYGAGAGYSMTTGNYSTYIGHYTGYFATGGGNVFVGNSGSSGSAGCGYYMTTGSNNVIIGGYTGDQDGLDIRTASNFVVLSTGQGNRQLSMYEGGTVALDSAVPVAGTGITFPATQSASSDANTLDDYEEGTWTASFVPNTSGSITMTLNTGTYTKVGRIVTINGLFKVSSVSSPTGYLKINGLPFSGGSNASLRCSISIVGDSMNATMTTTLVASVQGGSEIYVFKTDGVGGLALTTAADMKANTEIFVGGTYTID